MANPAAIPMDTIPIKTIIMPANNNEQPSFNIAIILFIA
jgi:hypothetical protein